MARILSNPIRETLRLRHNTSHSNARSGYVIGFSQSTLPAEIDHNIGFGNGGFGITVDSGDSLIVSCNDWFANALGAVSGIPWSATDLAIDPLFCDVDADDVTLLDTSSLLDAPGCGLIGARGWAAHLRRYRSPG